MPSLNPSSWLHRYALLCALATLALLGLGGLVTSRGVGMAVPDWPTTYGYNMFLFPVSQWVGGIFYEHTHRLVASAVGLLVVGLTRWLGGWPARLPLALAGLAETVAGCLLLRPGPEWHGAGHFLAGIGGVLLLGAAIWTHNPPAPRPLPALGWLALATVQVQGLLGGLRVVLFNDQLGILHAALAQLFFVLLCAIALLTSRWWTARVAQTSKSPEGAPESAGSAVFPRSTITSPPLSTINSPGLSPLLLLLPTLLIFAQLVLGAAMRHEHAGLAIPDFPLAYGKLWPAMDPDSVARYNHARLEVTALNPISAFQIGLQMAHRLLALSIFGLVLACTWSARRRLAHGHLLRKWTAGWLALILVQVGLGAATIWSNKAADIATAHVLVGALSLAVGGLLCVISFPGLAFAREPLGVDGLHGANPQPELR